MIRPASVVLIMLLFSAGCAGTPAGRVTDADKALAARVKAALIRDPQIHAAPIAVTAEDGHIRLRGFVETEAERRQVERRASAVNGVRSISIEIEVK